MSRIVSLVRNNRLFVVFALLMVTAAVSFAQTAEPPEITLPIDDMFSYLSSWITVFGPVILFIGMIPVALALLRYVLGLFQKAFGGSR